MQPARRLCLTRGQQTGALGGTARCRHVANTRTARIECATRWNRGKTRHRTFDLREPLVVVPDVWNRAHQADRIGMLRMMNHLRDRKSVV